MARMVLSDHLIYGAGVLVVAVLVGLIRDEIDRWLAFRKLRREQLRREQASTNLEAEWLEFSRRNP